MTPLPCHGHYDQWRQTIDSHTNATAFAVAFCGSCPKAAWCRTQGQWTPPGESAHIELPGIYGAQTAEQRHTRNELAKPRIPICAYHGCDLPLPADRNIRTRYHPECVRKARQERARAARARLF